MVSGEGAAKRRAGLARAPAIELDVPIAERTRRLLEDYRDTSTAAILAAVPHARRRLGEERFACVVSSLESGDRAGAVVTLLAYYDQAYANRVHGHERTTLARFALSITAATIVAWLASRRV